MRCGRMAWRPPLCPWEVFSDLRTNMRTQVEMLEYLAKVAKGPTQKLEVRCCCAAVMSANFQFVP